MARDYSAPVAEIGAPVIGRMAVQNLFPLSADAPVRDDIALFEVPVVQARDDEIDLLILPPTEREHPILVKGVDDRDVPAPEGRGGEPQSIYVAAEAEQASSGRLA